MKFSFISWMKLLFILFLFIFCYSSFAQIRINAGGFIGGGTIKGDSPSIGTFTTSVFFETSTILFLEVSPRFSFVYAIDFEAIIPNTKKPYYPFMQGFSFKGITTQYFENKIFLEEGVGFLALNDRTFSDTNTWNIGIVLALSGGWDLRGFNLSGFKLGAGIEYGITFNNTLAQYSSFHIYFNHSF